MSSTDRENEFSRSFRNLIFFTKLTQNTANSYNIYIYMHGRYLDRYARV